MGVAGGEVGWMGWGGWGGMGWVGWGWVGWGGVHIYLGSAGRGGAEGASVGIHWMTSDG